MKALKNIIGLVFGTVMAMGIYLLAGPIDERTDRFDNDFSH